MSIHLPLLYIQQVDIQQQHTLTSNIQAVLGQITNGGRAKHLQLVASKVSFILLERTLGRVFEQLVEDNLLAAGKEERSVPIAQGTFRNGVPAVTVVVDGGWSKRSHKHSYNAKSGVGVIFGAATTSHLNKDQVLFSLCHQ